MYFQSFEITRVFKFHYTKTREVGFYSSGKEQGGGAYRWLRYVHWYAGTASSPDVTLKAFFDAPVVHTDWKIKRSDEELVRFGHVQSGFL